VKKTNMLLALRQGEVDFSVAKVADFTALASELKVLGTFDIKRIPPMFFVKRYCDFFVASPLV